MGQLHGLREMMGTPAQPLPPHLREMAEWAESERARMTKRRHH